MDLESGLRDLSRLLASSFGPLGGTGEQVMCPMIGSWTPIRLSPMRCVSTGADKIIETESKTILVSNSGPDLLSVLSPAYGRLSLVIKSVQVSGNRSPNMKYRKGGDVHDSSPGKGLGEKIIVNRPWHPIRSLVERSREEEHTLVSFGDADADASRCQGAQNTTVLLSDLIKINLMVHDVMNRVSFKSMAMDQNAWP